MHRGKPGQTQEEGDIYKSRREATEEANPADTLISDF